MRQILLSVWENTEARKGARVCVWGTLAPQVLNFPYWQPQRLQTDASRMKQPDAQRRHDQQLLTRLSHLETTPKITRVSSSGGAVLAQCGAAR